ncbi:hypothetical protein ONS95_008570 [Cadophora gregata]|uniref:uncharacterized protein n=1 Tax=Cadophora gregata TaxID=51156 RepID=UPI0026DD7FA6|nr:uncharacterized protein ONS95_008570 [Cadophora gregata]KAK0099816.1 hypothetical protein ONS95_008570 [Cadophora gregata]KAK0123579.1 hypothetical protein ONS96_010557 [Cadophora gregata f. sp. sojae]
MAIMPDDKEPASSSTPPTKYSRYRRQAVKPEPEPEPVPVQNPNNDFARSKSMSRYRRSVVPAKAAQIADSSNPPVPALPRALNTNGADVRTPVRQVTEPANNGRIEERQGGNNGRSQGRPRETEEERMRRKVKEFQEREEQQRKVQAAKDEQERLRKQRREEEELQRMAEEEPERLLAEQKRKDLERLQAELDAAPPPLPACVASPKKEKFAFFSRKRAATKTTPPTTSGSGSGTNSMSKSRSHEPPRSTEVSRSTDLPRGIEQGGGGIVPQTDAPISASNAGERRVLIRCMQSSINLPITPETTPVDIIYSSANIMSQNIIPSTAILLESYTQLGLERRVRRYEHIRDIMNSWDRDTQNALLLINSDSPNFDKDLEPSSIPKAAPASVTVLMYHSQKPGKWSKRYVTLLSSGQMYTAKKAGAKMSDKDVLSICHLSDFDIYTPTAQQTRKVLKPPKKYCYAVKSQQKTTMFLSTENFVHFFSSDDLSIAEKFYDAVQNWRSWYLVNKMGEGKKVENKKILELTERGRTGNKAGHAVKVSVDENPYTIGSFQPLMDLNRFNNGSDEYDSEEENMPRQIPFHLRNSVSLSPRESRRHPPPVSYKLPPEAEDEFASSGLLGRTYSQRLKVSKEREEKQGPFIEGPSLLNGPGPGHQRTLSVKSTKAGKRPQTSGAAGNGGGDLQRGPSQKIPKPLLDFTPTFQEPPQWDRKGKGHGVVPVEGVPLVEIATTPESGMPEIPRSGTVFRRDARPATSSGAFVKGGLVTGGAGAGGMMNRGRANHD